MKILRMKRQPKRIVNVSIFVGLILGILISLHDFPILESKADHQHGSSSYIHYETVDGIGTITICDPNDDMKCITMKDRNEGATEAGIGCINYSGYCHPNWDDDYASTGDCILSSNGLAYCLGREYFGDVFEDEADCESRGQSLYDSCMQSHSGVFGYHFQWGNNSGFSLNFSEGEITGNQRVDCSTFSPSMPYGSGVFVVTIDWCTTATKNANLRGGSGDKQSNNWGYDETGNVAINVTGRQGPCPIGYHVPSLGEWNKLLEYWGENNGIELDVYNGLIDDYYVDKLPFLEDFKIPLAGYRERTATANVVYVGTDSYFWSSSPISTTAAKSYFYSFALDWLYPSSENRSMGYSVRCFKNYPLTSFSGETESTVITLRFYGGTGENNSVVRSGEVESGFVISDSGTLLEILSGVENIGYILSGWNVSGANNSFDLSTPITQDLDLYAMWLEDSIMVTLRFYNGIGGNNSIIRSGEVESGFVISDSGTLLEILSGAENTWYIFSGWYESGANNPFNLSDPIMQDLDLYAMGSQDFIEPTVVISTYGNNMCTSGGALYTVTGIFSENVTGVDISTLTMINGVVQNFIMVSENTAVWTVSFGGSTGFASVIINTGTFIDLAGNINTQASNIINWEFDNQSPETPVIISEPEYTQGLTNTVYSTIVSDIGCAGGVLYQFCLFGGRGTEALLLSGYAFNVAISNLVRGGTVVSIERTGELLENIEMVNLGVVSGEVLARYDGGNRKVYVYTDKDVLKFNPDSASMFYDMEELVSISLGEIDTSSVTNMNQMFAGCSSLVELDLSQFDTSKVEQMNEMFEGCRSLTTIYASSDFVVGNVVTSEYMFQKCESLVGGMGTLYNNDNVDGAYAHIDGGNDNPGYFTRGYFADLSGTVDKALLVSGTAFNEVINHLVNKDLFSIERTGVLPEKVDTVDLGVVSGEVLARYDDKEQIVYIYTDRDVIKFNPDSSSMFVDMNKLESINLGEIDTSSVTNMKGMFAGCSSLTELDLSQFDTSSVTNMNQMFEGCRSLTTIYASSDFVVGNVVTSEYMFQGCESLVGGMGTLYDRRNVNAGYAHMDRGNDNPGYFTETHKNISCLMLSDWSVITGATFTELADGYQYGYAVRSMDGVGNISEWSRSKTSIQDGSGPNISIIEDNSGYSRERRVSANVIDDVAGVYTVQYAKTENSVCSESTTNWTSAISYENGSDIILDSEYDNGKYICFKAVDNVGNVSFERSAQITGIDRTVPSVVISSDKNGMCSNSMEYIVTGVFSEVVTELYSSDLTVINGSVKSFNKYYGNVVRWKISPLGVYYYGQRTGGVNTITVCDPDNMLACITMMDRNLGATTNDIANTGSYGYHYQWGNNYGFEIGGGCFISSMCGDGVTSNSTTDRAIWDNSYNNYGYNGVITNFMKGGTDYRENDVHYDGLRGGSGDNQSNNRGYDTVNNVAINVTGRQGPCPTGYHVPSIGEWNKLLEYWAKSRNVNLVGGNRLSIAVSNQIIQFIEDFKIPFAGTRLGDYGRTWAVGQKTYLWSSSLTGDKAVMFHIIGPDSLVYFYYNNRSDGESVRCFKNESFDIYGSGTITVVINTGVFTDLAENANTQASNMLSWSYDLVGPTGTIDVTYNGDDTYATGIELNLALTASDLGCNNTVSQMQFSCDEISWSPAESFATTKNFSLAEYSSAGCTTGDGNKTIYVRYIDGLGNTGEVYSDTIMFDANAPTCNIQQSPVSGTWTTGNVVLTAVVTETNPDKYSWTGFDNMVSNLTTWTMTGNGTKTMYLKDIVGNTGSCSVEINYIDNMSPECTWGMPSKTGLKAGDTGSITLTCADLAGIVTNSLSASDITLNNSYIVLGNNVVTGGTLTGRTYTFTYTAIDNVVGSVTLILPAGKIFDVVGNSNDITSTYIFKSGGTITICNPNNSTKCITMMDRNLGATEFGTGINSYGYHYQWGNNHGFMSCNENWCNTFPGGETTVLNQLVDTTNYGPGNYFNSGIFVKISQGPRDWSIDKNNNLWGGSGDNAANNRGYDRENNVAINVTGRQGPCPEGYHVPSIGEWSELVNYWGGNNTGLGYDLNIGQENGLSYITTGNNDMGSLGLARIRFQNDFGIPLAGGRDYYYDPDNGYDATVLFVGLGSNIWSSSYFLDDRSVYMFDLRENEISTVNFGDTAGAVSLRCFKNYALNSSSSVIVVDSLVPIAQVEYQYFVSGTLAILTGYSEQITITNNGGSDTMRFPYTGSDFRGVFEYQDNVGNTGSNDVWGWNNEWYINAGFWNSNPTTGEIVNAVYGDGNGDTDRTAYSKLWTGVNCATGSMKVKYINSQSGLNAIPNTLAADTIYVLNGGAYTKNSALNMNNCSALIGKTDNVVLYSTSRLDYQVRSDTKYNVVIDNIKINGTRVNQYSTGTQHIPNSYGIFIYTGANNTTINNVESYEQLSAGLLVQYASNIVIENSQFYNNEVYGLYLYPDSTRYGITVNNIQAYGNRSRGIYTNGGSSAGYYTKISINNSQIYNNGSYGVQVYRNNGLVLNNVEIYNNSSYGIYVYQCSGTVVNDAKIYNNGNYALFTESSGIGTKYYGTLQYFGNGYAAVTNSTARLAIGSASDYPNAGFSNGSTSNAGTMSCDLATKNNHFVQNVSASCNNKSVSWVTRLDRQPSRYIYGSSQKKQTQPLAYINGTLTKFDTTGYNYNTNKYLGEVNPVSLVGTINMTNDMRYTESQTVPLILRTSNSSATYTITGDVTMVTGTMSAYSKTVDVTLSEETGYKDVYVTYTANGQTATDHIIIDYINITDPIIDKYYGSGSEYIKTWDDNNVCDPAQMTVQTLNPGTNTIPQALAKNTIYVLNPGTYIMTGYRYFNGNCIALVGSGDVVIYGSYNPGTTSQAKSSMIYMSNLRNNIIENIKLDGTNNGAGGTHTSSLFGIWVYNFSRYNTINNVQAFNMASYGVYISSNVKETLVNNSQFFNNGTYGIYLASSSPYNTINNVQCFNNGTAGIGLYSSTTNIIQNSQLYNNGKYGLSRNSSVNVRVLDTKIYNNGIAGLYLQGTLSSSYTMYSNNLWIFNNPSVFAKTGSVTNPNIFYHGDLKVFGNDDNTLGALFSGTNKMSSYGWTNGVLSTTGEMGCDLVANPRNSEGVFLQTGNFCDTRGQLTGWTNTYITGIMYGNNQIKQKKPMWLNIGGSINYYGTQPFDYDITKPIAYAYPITDIILQATATAADQTLKINKYFANDYTVDRGDGSGGLLSSDTTHTYSESGIYTITLSLAGGADRWTFTEIYKPLVPIEGTTMTGVKITYMPSLADGFGNSATNPGNSFFYFFNSSGAITSLPTGSFDTSNITTAGDRFFSTFNQLGLLESLPENSFNISNISGAVGDQFFSRFNYGGVITSLPDGSFDTSHITSVGDNFFRCFNNAGALTSLPNGSFDTSNITSVGDNFFDAFNEVGQITSLPEGSFNISNISGAVGDDFLHNFNHVGALTDLSSGSFNTTNITSVGDNFFNGFNEIGQLTSLPTGSFNISNISGAVGDNFFAQFNYEGQLTSLPSGSFNISNITSVGSNFFYAFNALSNIATLPSGSFNTSNITTVGDDFFAYFNYLGAIAGLPEGSFDTSNIMTVGDEFFFAFNFEGRIGDLPESFTMSSVGASGIDGYSYAFYSQNYSLNRNVYDLVSGVTVPLDGRNTFSDNQPGRCGVHENWLVSKTNACHITYDSNGGSTATTTKNYDADMTGVVAGSGITTPTRANSQFVGWYTGIQTGSQVSIVLFPAMDSGTLYAYWNCDTGYKISGDACILNKDIVLQATATSANKTLKINKYFANDYTVDRGDGSGGLLSSDTTHTYSESGTYTIILSLTGGASRWTFTNNTKPLVPTNGTTMTGVQITYMPSLADGFGNSATNPGNNFFYFFNDFGAITSLPTGSFDTSNITSAGSNFFAYFNYVGSLTNLPDGSFDTSNITSAGSNFFDFFNSYGALTSLPNGSFKLSGITSAGDDFFAYFNYNGSLTSLPNGSFDTSHITSATHSFFDSFNRNGALTSLPNGSFNTENITSVGSYFFASFNNAGALTSLPNGSFDISNITGAGNFFFNQFNYSGALTSLPDGSFDTLNITSVGHYFFASFNRNGSLTSLPDGSFKLSGITSAGGDFFASFNENGALTSLPNWSFNLSGITSAGQYFFRSFNKNGSLASLPHGSFDTSNIISADGSFFESFNESGAIVNLPSSFSISSVGAGVSSGYLNAFNSPNYTLNKSVTELVAGVTAPSSDRDTFSDNQPGRCGVNENWLVTPLNDFASPYIPIMTIEPEYTPGLTNTVSSTTVADIGCNGSVEYQFCISAGDIGDSEMSGNVEKAMMMSGPGVNEIIGKLNVRSIQRTDQTPAKGEIFELGINTGEILGRVDGIDLYIYTTKDVIQFPQDSSSMFAGMGKLVSIDLGEIDTSNVMNMAGMFNGCNSLTGLDLSSFDTSNVEYMTSMFNGCSSLTTIYTSTKFTTRNVQSSTRMFNGCISLVGGAGTIFDSRAVDATRAKIDELTQNPGYFTDINGSNKAILQQGSDINKTIYELKITSIQRTNQAPGKEETTIELGINKGEIVGWVDKQGTLYIYTDKDIIQFPQDSAGMFYGMSSLVSIDLGNIDTSNVMNMAGMFNGCSSLTGLDLSSFDTSNVVHMDDMFYGCSSLTGLDLSSFDTSNVVRMDGMFAGCSRLTGLDLSSFDTSNVTNMDGMFAGCSSLTTIYTSTKFTVRNVQSSTNMFDSCTSLVGGAGTTFDGNEKVDATRAHIDELTQNPGYFTDINGSNKAILQQGSDINKTIGKLGVISIQRTDQAPGKEETIIDLGINKGEILGWVDKQGTLYIYTDKDIIQFPQDSAEMFYGMSDLVSIDLGDIDTSNVVRMAGMFNGCSGLTELDLSSFDTSNVTNMKSMFEGCNSLTTIYTSTKFTTRNVQDSTDMFDGCTSLVGGAGTTFDGKEALDATRAHIDGGEQNPGYFTKKLSVGGGKVQPKKSGQTGNTEPTRAILKEGSGFNAAISSFKDVTSIQRTNQAPGEEETVELGINKGEILGWYDGKQGILYIYTDKDIIQFPQNSEGMFYGMSSLVSIDLGEIDTSNVMNMKSMFEGCSGLTGLDLSSFDTSNVMNMNGMFNGCSNLTGLDLSSFDTSNVTNMGGMFYGCSSLTTIYTSTKFTTRNVQSSKSMFDGCTSLVGGAGTLFDGNEDLDKTRAHIDELTQNPGYFTDINGSNKAILKVGKDINTAIGKLGVISIQRTNQAPGKEETIIELGINKGEIVGWVDKQGTLYIYTDKDIIQFPQDSAIMFHNMSDLVSIDLGNIDTSNVTNMGDMFKGCSSLTGLDLSSFDTSNVEDMTSMFNGCSSLTGLDLSSFDTSNVTNMGDMFKGCSSLTTIYTSTKFTTRNVQDSTDMFDKCDLLVGGAGTTFDGKEDIDATRANIDELTQNPGYFTDINGSNKAILQQGSDIIKTIYELKIISIQRTDQAPGKEETTIELGINKGEIVGWVDKQGTLYIYTDKDIIQFPQDSANMFAGMSDLLSIDLGNIDTSNVVRMAGMFKGYSGLTGLDLSSFDTSNVEDMTSMFDGCSSLTGLDLSSFDTSNVTNMDGMFAGCSRLTTIYTSTKFTVRNVQSSTNMFDLCTSLVGGVGTPFDGNEALDATRANIDESGQNPGYFTPKSVTANIHGDDPGENPGENNFSCIVTSEWSINPYTTFTGLSDGQTYYYFVRSRDGLGNISEWSSGTSSTQDNLGPEITISYLGNEYDVEKRISANITDSLAGVATMNYVKTDNPVCNGNTANWSHAESYVNNIQIILNSENDNGKYICFRAVDNVGNVSFGRSAQITGIDRTDPSVVISSDENGMCVPSNTVYTITGIFSEDISVADTSILTVTNGVAQSFSMISGNVAEWIVRPWVYPYEKEIDGINTITVCNPNDSTKCITMMDKNLGASEAGTGQESYGNYYQWGNNYGFANTGTVITGGTRVNCGAYSPSNPYNVGTFIIVSYSDWCTTGTRNDNLRGGSGDNQSNNWGYDVVNNVAINVTGRQGPCPTGYHVPSAGEWNKLLEYWTISYTGQGNTNDYTKKEGAIQSDFMIPFAGYRHFGDAEVVDIGNYFYIWSSSPLVNDDQARQLRILRASHNLSVSVDYRAYGQSVRCFKDETLGTYPIGNGTVTVVIKTGAFADLAGNTNTQASNILSVEYDNAGPDFVFDNVQVPECTPGTMVISGVTQSGCAGTHGIPYSRDGGTTWTSSSYLVLSGMVVGNQEIVAMVRDAFGNYTQKTATISWTDTLPTANNFLVNGVGTGKTVNWKELSNATDGNCGNSGLVATVKTDATSGSCVIDGDYINFVANEGVSGSDSCAILITDDDNSTGEFMVTWNDISRPIPQISFVDPTPAHDSVVNQNRFTTKMSIGNIDSIKSLVYNYSGKEYDLTSGLILMYNFDNVATLGESSTVVKDLSNNGNDGTVNGATWTGNGVYGGAFSFNGTTSNYIDFPSYGPLNQNGTISVWVKGSKTQNGLIIGSYNSIALGFYNSKIIGSTTSSLSKPQGIISNYDDNGWNHIVVSMNNGTMSYYINGIKLSNSTSTYWGWTDSGTGRVGMKNQTTYHPFNGMIDEIRVYDRALTQDEVQFLYKSNLKKTDVDTWEFETLNTCLVSEGAYNLVGTVESFVDTSGSVSRNVTSDIPLVSVDGTGYNFGSYVTTGSSYVLSGTMGTLTVTDMLGNSGRLLYLATSDTLKGQSTRESISTENLKFRANSLAYNGMYEGYANTHVAFGNGISTIGFSSAYSSGCAAGQEYCTGNNAEILEYMVRTSDVDDFMCGDVGTYSDNMEIELQVPAWQIQDEYKGTLWITLQDEYGIEQNGTRFSDDGGERTILENQSKRGDSEQKEESKKEEPKKDKLEQEEESGQGEPKQEKLKQEEKLGQEEPEQGEPEQESGDLKDLDGESEKTAIKIKN